MDKYTTIKERQKINVNELMELFKQTYWAKTRTKETIIKMIENSKCYGVINEEGILIAFARVITDYSTTFYLADVIVDESHRGKGISRMLMEEIHNDEDIKDLFGLLLTSTAQGLYEKYGYKHSREDLMIHMPK